MIVLLVVALFGGVYGAVDLTVTDKATGSAVVNAVVDIITQSCVFDNDRLMLRRIAYAETKDGTANFTFTRGGIWQVDEASFKDTQMNSSVALMDDILNEFGIDWKQTKYEDLQKPLYSGIAAMLKISTYYSQSYATIPQSVSGQARYWASSYTVNTWQNAIEVYTNASADVDNTCSSPKADVVFVVDSSGSIRSRNFQKVKSFIVSVVDSFEISNETVRVGLIEFSDSAYIEFDLQQYSNKSDVKAAVAAIPYYGQGTNSAAGLNTATEMIQQQGRQHDGVPVVAIFLTDGRSNSQQQTALAAENLHTTLPEVTVFAVGVGSNINENELTTIASEPKCNHVYFLAAFSDITSFTSQIMNDACKAQGELEEEQEVSGTVTEDQNYYFKIRVRKETNGVRVQLRAKSGAVRTYYSWKVENPNDALHDFVSEVDSNSGSVVLNIGWDAEAERNAEEVFVFNGTNQTTLEAVLYGTVVGVGPGQNEFTLSYLDGIDLSQNDVTTSSYVNSAVVHTGHLLSILAAASVLLLSKYFCRLL